MAKASKRNAVQASAFLPQTGERSIFVGQTGSGKTAAAAWMLQRLEASPIVIYDTKGEQKFKALKNSLVVESWSSVLEAFEAPDVDYIIFRPSEYEVVDPVALDAYLYQHYESLLNVPAYIDEVLSFHKGGRAGPGLTALLTRGRSRGQTTIMSTQRPKFISRFAMTETQKFYIFRLTDRRDKVALADVIPEYDKAPMLDKFWFHFFEIGTLEYHLFKPIKLDRGTPTGYVDVSPESDPVAPARSLIWI